MHKQKGMSFIGVVLLIATIVFVAVIVMKLTPYYLEFATVKKALTSISNDSEFKQMDKKKIQEMFRKIAGIDDIKSIDKTDLLIVPGDSGPVVSVDYEVIVPLVANVSALLRFQASTDESASFDEESAE